jgi:hypothetical protein
VSAFPTVFRGRRGRVVTVLAVSTLAATTAGADARGVDRSPAGTDVHTWSGGPYDDDFDVEIGGGFDLAYVGGRRGGEDVPDVHLPVIG